MNENQFWIKQFTNLAISILIICLLITISDINQRYQVRKMVENCIQQMEAGRSDAIENQRIAFICTTIIVTHKNH